MQRIGGTQQCEVYQSALFKTNATVIKGAGWSLVVDPNWLPREIDFLVDRAFVRGSKNQNYLLFTHSDYDHIIGAGAFPERRTIASEAFVDNSQAEAQIEQIRQFDDDYYIDRDYDIYYPKIDEVIAKDGQTLPLPSETLHFWQAPGHNADGLLTLLENQRIFISGDYLCDVEFPYLYHSLHDYRTTLDKIEKLYRENRFDLLLPGHGAITRDSKEIRKRLRESRDYLNQLEAHVRNNIPFDENRLYQRYDYPRLMRKFHRANIELVRKELSESALTQ